jgi:hypothetical protein
MSVNSTNPNLPLTKKKKRKRVEDSEEMIDMFNLDLTVCFLTFDNIFMCKNILQSENDDSASASVKKPRLMTDNVQVEITDDKEGYYLFRIGEVISHYRIVSLHGKGVFGTVVKAEDTRPDAKTKEVAIKISRNNEAMYIFLFK